MKVTTQWLPALAAVVVLGVLTLTHQTEATFDITLFNAGGQAIAASDTSTTTILTKALAALTASGFGLGFFFPFIAWAIIGEDLDDEDGGGAPAPGGVPTYAAGGYGGGGGYGYGSGNANAYGAPPAYGAPASQGYSPPASQGYSPPASQGYGSPASQGYSSAASQGYSSPASQGYGSPASQGNSASQSFGGPPPVPSPNSSVPQRNESNLDTFSAPVKRALYAMLKVASQRGKRSLRAAHHMQSMLADRFEGLFATMVSTDPDDCYRRIICDLSTGRADRYTTQPFLHLLDDRLEKIFQTFFKPSIRLFELGLREAKIFGEVSQSVDKCEARFHCPVTGQELDTLVAKLGNKLS